MKMVVGPTREIGATDGATDLDWQPLPMVIRTKENLDWINVMDVASIAGQMAGFMMENIAKMYAMGKEPVNGRTGPSIQGTFVMGSEKGKVAIRSRMVAIMSEVGKMDNMKDLEVRR